MSFNVEEKLSYMAANVFPIKILKHMNLLRSIREDKRILPIHVQLNPTNRCNFSCAYCSCSNRDRDFELSVSEITHIMKLTQSLGCQSVTVTGGGEPLAHKAVREYLRNILDIGVEIGLVTNAVLLPRLNADILHKLTWCRISSSDELPEQMTRIQLNMDNWFKRINDACKHASIDWAFSHVLTRNPNYKLMQKLIEFANDHNFTHIRIVSDLLDLNAVQDMTQLQAKMRDLKVDDHRVIYQGRKQYTKGQNPCYISLLKPVIGADGNIYPCCIDSEETVVVERANQLMTVPMKELNIGDTCFSDNGKEVITNIFRHVSSSPILEVSLRGGRSLRVSKDHVMMTAIGLKVKRDQIKEYARKTVVSYSLKETRASELRVGNYIPLFRKLAHEAPYSASLSKDYAKLLGYYTAEGWCDKDNRVSFMLGKKDVISNDLLQTLEALGITYRIYDRRTGDQVCLHAKSCPPNLRDYLSQCGARASKKHIPTIILNSPDDIKLEYLHALIKGDGSINRRANNPSFELRLTTVSRRLASDVCTMLMLMNIHPTLVRTAREGEHVIEGRKVHVHDKYTLSISGYRNLERFKGLKLWDVKHKRGISLDFPKTDSLMFVPVAKIEEVNSSTELYDIKVSPSNRFFTGMGFLVHNCGCQYSLPNPSRNYEPLMRMGDVSSFRQLIEEQRFFNGSICNRCYYKEYNDILHLLLTEIKHLNFV